MDVPTLLSTASRAGLRIVLRDDTIVVRGPRRAAPLAAEIGRYAVEVVALIEAEQATERGATCDRCGTIPRPRDPIPTYWGEQLCPDCCAVVVTEHDANESWPPVPW